MARIWYVGGYVDPEYTDEPCNDPEEMMESIVFFTSQAAATGYLHAKWEELVITHHELILESPEFIKYTNGFKIVWGPGQTLRIFIGDHVA